MGRSRDLADGTLAELNVDSDTLAVDATNNRVGVGTASPSYKLHSTTSDGSNIAGYFYNSAGSGNATALLVRGGANNSTPTFQIQDYGGNSDLEVTGTGNLKFNSGYGSAATAYGCRAWVNFDGTGTVAIRASGNVSSITDVGVGDYTVNFTTALSDTNYATICNANCDRNGASFSGWFGVNATNAGVYANKTTTAVRVGTITSGSAAIDFFDCGVSVFR